jgi:transposase-like protein
MLTLSRLINDNKCYETVRHLRWPNGVCCVECGSAAVTKRGKHETYPARQRYACNDCGRQFDDLTGSIFAGRHQPLHTWIACLYLMGLNLSNQQIAQELSLHKDDVQQMTSELREAVTDKRPEVQLSGTVEFDEVYVTAGHKGQPESVKKKAAKGGGANSKGFGVAVRSKKRNPRSSP